MANEELKQLLIKLRMDSIFYAKDIAPLLVLLPLDQALSLAYCQGFTAGRGLDRLVVTETLHELAKEV